MLLLGTGAWFVLRGEPAQPTPVSPRPSGVAPDGPPAAEGSRALVDANGLRDDRRVDPDSQAAPSPAAPAYLRVEFVDEAGAPVARAIEVEYRERADPGATPEAPVRLTARGPRVEARLTTALFAPAQGEVLLSARTPGLIAEATVPPMPAGRADWVRVPMRATTLVRGTLVDARGEPIENVAVLMRDDVPGREAHSRALTDAAGRFEIDALPDRVNRLFVGDAAYPWVKAIPIDARSGSRELDPIRVELYAARFQVLRADGVPARGARLDGIGLEGGRFAATADDDGRALVTTLLAGRWRVNVSEPTHGRASRAVEIPLEQDEAVLILLPR